MSGTGGEALAEEPRPAAPDEPPGPDEPHVPATAEDDEPPAPDDPPAPATAEDDEPPAPDDPPAPATAEDDEPPAPGDPPAPDDLPAPATAEDDTPAPPAEDVAPVLAVGDDAPAPPSQDGPPVRADDDGPTVEHEAPDPTIEDEAPDPTVEVGAPDPTVVVHAPPPPAQEESAAPTVQDEAPHRAIQDDAPVPDDRSSPPDPDPNPVAGPSQTPHEDLPHEDLPHEDLPHEDLPHEDLPHEDLGVAPAATAVPLSDELLRAREVHRRHRRQTLTFIGAFLAVLLTGFAAFTFYEGMWSWPFGDERPASRVLACQSSSSRLVPAKRVTVRVYNASKRQGLAFRVTRQLQKVGFKVEATGNDPLGTSVKTSAVLRYGPNGEHATYTVAAYLKGRVVRAKDDRLSDTVDVVLGSAFTLRPPAETKKALAAQAKALGAATCEDSTPAATR